MCVWCEMRLGRISKSGECSARCDLRICSRLGYEAMSAGLETRKRLRLDGSGSEPQRKGVIAGVFKSDIFFKNEEQYTGVEIDKQQAVGLALYSGYAYLHLLVSSIRILYADT